MLIFLTKRQSICAWVCAIIVAPVVKISSCRSRDIVIDLLVHLVKNEQREAWL